MLSVQKHYDWGLRALKTTLRGCGSMRADNTDKNEKQIIVDVSNKKYLSVLKYSFIYDKFFKFKKKKWQFKIYYL